MDNCAISLHCVLRSLGIAVALGVSTGNAANVSSAESSAPATAAGIRIEFGQLMEQPGKVQLQQAVITEEDRAGNALKTIRADHAESNGLDASNSTWAFSGHVVVTIPDGELRAETATVLIMRGRISTAAVTGVPATFEQRGAASGTVRASGRANDIAYNAVSGDLLFTGSVWFTSENTGEISSSRATYNIPLRSSSFEKGDNERVHGTIRLKPRGGDADRTP